MGNPLSPSFSPPPLVKSASLPSGVTKKQPSIKTLPIPLNKFLSVPSSNTSTPSTSPYYTPSTSGQSTPISDESAFTSPTQSDDSRNSSPRFTFIKRPNCSATLPTITIEENPFEKGKEIASEQSLITEDKTILASEDLEEDQGRSLNTLAEELIVRIYRHLVYYPSQASCINHLQFSLTSKQFARIASGEQHPIDTIAIHLYKLLSQIHITLPEEVTASLKEKRVQSYSMQLLFETADNILTQAVPKLEQASPRTIEVINWETRFPIYTVLSFPHFKIKRIDEHKPTSFIEKLIANFNVFVKKRRTQPVIPFTKSRSAGQLPIRRIVYNSFISHLSDELLIKILQMLSKQPSLTSCRDHANFSLACKNFQQIASNQDPLKRIAKNLFHILNRIHLNLFDTPAKMAIIDTRKLEYRVQLVFSSQELLLKRVISGDLYEPKENEVIETIDITNLENEHNWATRLRFPRFRVRISTPRDIEKKLSVFVTKIIVNLNQYAREYKQLD